MPATLLRNSSDSVMIVRLVEEIDWFLPIRGERLMMMNIISLYYMLIIIDVIVPYSRYIKEGKSKCFQCESVIRWGAVLRGALCVHVTIYS